MAKTQAVSKSVSDCADEKVSVSEKARERWRGGGTLRGCSLTIENVFSVVLKGL
jgi:hypothetical protein